MGQGLMAPPYTTLMLLLIFPCFRMAIVIFRAMKSRAPGISTAAVRGRDTAPHTTDCHAFDGIFHAAIEYRRPLSDWRH